MTTEDIRLECLRMAASLNPSGDAGHIVKQAEKLVAYLEGQATGPAETSIAEVGKSPLIGRCTCAYCELVRAGTQQMSGFPVRCVRSGRLADLAG